MQRIVVVLGVEVVWGLQYVFGKPFGPSLWFVVFVSIYALASLAYRRFLVFHPNGGVFVQYAFLILDPPTLIGLLIQDPRTFAFLNPFLLIVVVRCGLRYGMRTMFLAWGCAVLASPLLFMSPYWRRELELTVSFLLMLMFVPVFFSSLIRRIHNVRAVEEERARMTALHELAVVRSGFLAKVSHELRSPLEGIVSALDVIEMRHSRAFEADAELIARMRRSSLLLNTLLRDLLTLAKGEAGHLELHPEPFDAVALVEALADGMRELAVAKGLDLSVELPAESIFVVADGARIDQVLSNLVSNSIRYTDSGQVRISLHEYDPALRRLRFSVADTGPGIPESVLPMLFSPDKMTSGAARRGEGSGIGLAIVRILVDHLGAKIAVKSHVGIGTTFTFDVPAEPAETESSAHVPGDSTGRILIVDDRDDVLDGLIGVADELGYECDRASSAAIGANLLAARKYEVVLLDIDMPVKGGAELAAETRRGDGPNSNARFVGMSAGEVAEAASRQFDACLAKPVDFAKLRRALLGAGSPPRPSQPGLWVEAG